MRERDVFDIVKRWAGLLLRFRKKSAYGHYGHFGQLGFLIFMGGIALLFPGVWETLFGHLVEVAIEESNEARGATPTDQSDLFSLRIRYSLACMGVGFFVILLSLLLFFFAHLNDQNKGQTIKTDEPAPSVNDGAITTKIPADCTLEDYVQAMVKPGEAIVSFLDVDDEVKALRLQEGDLSAESFEHFLHQISELTIPRNQVRFEHEGDNRYAAKPVCKETKSSSH